MPGRLFHPRKRGVHRVAVFALYRALLSKCPKIQIPDHLQRGKIHPVAEIIRKQFRRNVPFEAEMLVVAALKIGYEAEELLHNVVNGNPEARTKMLALLSGWQAQSHATRAIHAAHPPPPKTPHEIPRAHPGQPKLIDTYPKPRSEIPGPRRWVPKLQTANGFPLLVYHKPQSVYMGRIIRDKIALRLKRQRQVLKMEEALKGGSGPQLENEWDRHLGEHEKGSQGWKEVYQKALEEVRGKIRREAQGVKEMSTRFTRIYLEEKRLAAEEYKEWLRQKRRDIRLKSSDKRRREWREYLDTLSPEYREAAIVKLRQELAEKKREAEEKKRARKEGKNDSTPVSHPRDEPGYKQTPSRMRRSMERDREAEATAVAGGMTVEEWREMAKQKNSAGGTAPAAPANGQPKPLAPGMLAYKLYKISRVPESPERAERQAKIRAEQQRQASEAASREGLSVEEWIAREKERYIEKWGVWAREDQLWKEKERVDMDVLKALKRANERHKGNVKEGNKHREQQDEWKVDRPKSQGGDAKGFVSWRPNGGS